MKKILVLTALIMFAVSGSVFAASLANDAVAAAGLQIFGGVDAADAAAASSVLLGKTSKGVKFRGYLISTGVGFSNATYHGSGSKTYGTAHNSTAIYFKDIGVGAADDTWTLGTPSNAAFGPAWTAM